MAEGPSACLLSNIALKKVELAARIDLCARISCDRMNLLYLIEHLFYLLQNLLYSINNRTFIVLDISFIVFNRKFVVFNQSRKL